MAQLEYLDRTEISKTKIYPHAMPVETSIASTGAILVLEAIVETKADDSGRGVRSSEISEKLCLDWEKTIIFLVIGCIIRVHL